MQRRIDDLFTDAPAEVRTAATYVQFAQREHLPSNGYDFLQSLPDSPLAAEAAVVAEYLRGRGYDVEMPPRAYQPTVFLGDLPV